MTAVERMRVAVAAQSPKAKKHQGMSDDAIRRYVAIELASGKSAWAQRGARVSKPLCGSIYIIGCEGFHKVGMSSKRDARARITTHQLAIPFPVDVVAVVPIERDMVAAVERYLHKLLVRVGCQRLHPRREWFVIPAPILASLSAELTNFSKLSRTTLAETVRIPRGFVTLGLN